MFDSAVFDVVVGLIFLFATFAVVVSATTEAIARWLGLRGRQLLLGVRALVDGDAGSLRRVTNTTSTFELFRSPFMGSVGQEARTTYEVGDVEADENVPDTGNAVKLFARKEDMQAALEQRPWGRGADAKAARGKFRSLPSYISSRQFASAVLAEVVPSKDLLPLDQLSTAARRAIARPAGDSVAQPAVDAGQLTAALDDVVAALESTHTPDATTGVVTVSRADVENQVQQSGLQAAVQNRLLVVLDEAAGEVASEFAGLKEGIRSRFKNSTLSNALIGIVDEVGDDVEQIRTRLETTFDDHMDRVSGWYKRNAKPIQLAVAAAVVLVFNVNVLRVADHLANSESSRAAIVALAEDYDCSGDDTEECLETAVDELSSDLPIFWNSELCGEKCDSVGDWLLSGMTGGEGWWSGLLLALVGYVLTWLGLIPGSRFWFDALAKLNSLRSGGKPPAKSEPTT